MPLDAHTNVAASIFLSLSTVFTQVYQSMANYGVRNIKNKLNTYCTVMIWHISHNFLTPQKQFLNLGLIYSHSNYLLLAITQNKRRHNLKFKNNSLKQQP